MNQKYYNEGREWTAEEGGMEWAEWTAMLDNSCEFCIGRDGMFVEVGSPDFSEYSPGNVHERCHCFWLYYKSLPENYQEWRTPSKRDVKSFYQ
jgi:hypothetical protein